MIRDTRRYIARQVGRGLLEGKMGQSDEEGTLMCVKLALLRSGGISNPSFGQLYTGPYPS